MNNAERRPAIDLSRTHFKRELGDLAIAGTWLWNDDQETEEPCLVVTSRYRIKGFKPFVVALSAAYKYNEPGYLAAVAAELAKTLGSDSIMTAHKVATLIADHLHDLITMPPNPTTAIVVADATISDGRRSTSAEIVEHVPLRQS
jgi:hypothetical protein